MKFHGLSGKNGADAGLLAKPVLGGKIPRLLQVVGGVSNGEAVSVV